MCIFPSRTVLLCVARRNLQVVVQINVYEEEQRQLQLLPFIFSSLNFEIFLNFWLVLSVLGGAAVFRATVLRHHLYQHVFL